MHTSDELTFKKISLFWMPLSATWLMMAAEGPFLSAIIARMLNPEFNLAAFGVASSFAMIVEAPVILLMSASTALVKDNQSYTRLRNFTYILNLLVTGIMLLFIVPSVFYFITIKLVELPAGVANLTHTAMLLLIPWPAAIGYRRFYQGILIRHNLTRRVAYGTIVRLSSMALTGLALHFFTHANGAVVGAGALSTGVTCEAAASRIMSWKVVKKVKTFGASAGGTADLTYSQIFKFYLPLALTSLFSLGVQPMVTFFIGQSRMAIESLAVLPVINSFVFVFRSVGISFQEVGIALIGKNKEGYVPLRNFAVRLGIALVILIGIISLTPLADVWFHSISGLSMYLTNFSRIPLDMMIIIPGLAVLLSFETAVLVESKNTKPITFSTVVEFTATVLVMFISIKMLNLVGAVAASLGFLAGMIGAISYLFPFFIKSVSVRKVS